MPVYVALLRAINVGGTGVLPMKELARLCAQLGFDQVRTYIQSGNAIFESTHTEAEVRADLERALADNMGKGVDVLIRTAAELRAVLTANPFPDANPAQVGVVFLSQPAPPGLMDAVVNPGGEEVRLGNRELFIHYPDGMGRSKLKLPAISASTTRNLNTVAKLVAMTTDAT